VPEKGDSAPSPAETPEAPRYRRPEAEVVRRAARRVLRGRRAHFRSQAAFLEAVLDIVRRDEPLASIGGPRLRRLLVGTEGVRLVVHYTEREGVPPPEVCPVCGGELAPIRNRTLTGGSIVLGRRCKRCDYWTHAARRVPVRYAISKVDGPRGRPPNPR
jgi:hypothetical protein